MGHPTVFYDRDFDCYRILYMCFSPSDYFNKEKQGKIHYMCYAENRDGIHWTKLLLNVCNFQNFEKTNVVYCGADEKTARGQVFKDETEKDSEKKYKMVCLEIFPWKKVQKDTQAGYSFYIPRMD